MDQEAAEFVGEPMLLHLSQMAHDKIAEHFRNEEEGIDEKGSVNDDKTTSLTVIEIDHMRNRSKYVKCLEQFAMHLSVEILILHIDFKANHWIIVKHDSVDQLKEFVKRLKTQSVDVDAKGRPCKERLSKVLLTVTKAKSKNSLTNAKFEETVHSKDEIEAFLQKVGLFNELQDFF